MGLLKSQLENSGIGCAIRNEGLSGVALGPPFDPELWVLRDEQFGEAKEFLDAWQAAVGVDESTPS